ncbi:hypothetical protein V6N11_077455 [Hibiscus sabdariffa]|uniref:Uncharacterized protein n=1 Tax=Hibiscus sabdariffa TaxID=183260 RepID=A0ABR2TD42_9ROSI
MDETCESTKDKATVTAQPENAQRTSAEAGIQDRRKGMRERRPPKTLTDFARKNSWPELMGTNRESAKTTIERENPNVDAVMNSVKAIAIVTKRTNS